MRVRWLISLGGSCDGQPIVSGTVCEIGDTSAAEYIDRGQAELACPPEGIRAAVAAPARNAAVFPVKSAKKSKTTTRKGG